MLVLSRKVGERILVAHFELTVTVVAIDGNTVKLGITAPTNVGVYREELWRWVCGSRTFAPPSSGWCPVKSRNDANFASGLGISGAPSWR